MNMNHSKKQRGVVVVAVAIALPVLLLIMGLALDFGHVFVNKTRLQNALDATALSAAIAVNRDVTHSTTNASSAGRATFDRFKTASGNDELADLNGGELVFDYSRTLQPWGSFNPASDKFAFVRVTSTNMLNVTPVLIRILAQFSGDMPIPAIATAGPVGQNCDLVPLVICPSTTAETPIGCDATGCNGIPFHTKVCLKGGTKAAKQDTCQDSSFPSGNFGLLRFDGMAGGNDIEKLLAGSVNTCTNDPGWEPGNKVGPVSKGIEARFDADLVQTPYGEDQDTFPDGGYHPQYVSDTNVELAKIPIPAGTAYNRIMAVPVVDDCDKEPINIIAASCFLLTEQAQQRGGSNEIIGELTGVCPGPGTFSPTNPVLFGPYKIVLFKSPGSGDS